MRSARAGSQPAADHLNRSISSSLDFLATVIESLAIAATDVHEPATGGELDIKPACWIGDHFLADLLLAGVHKDHLGVAHGSDSVIADQSATHSAVAGRGDAVGREGL